MGQVIQAGVGQAPARQAAIFSGLPNTVITTTVNKVDVSICFMLYIFSSQIRSVLLE